MARIFLLKAANGKGKFFMSESDEYLYFFSPTLKDLRGTLRCVTAKGYRVPKVATLSKRINQHSGHLILKNPFFQTTMFEIFEINEKVEIKKEFEYENSFGFKHKLKVVENNLAESIVKR